MTYRALRKKTNSYDQFDATELYCPDCRRSTPVRKRLLLVLADGDKYDYVCSICGTSLGDKIDNKPNNLRFL